MINKLIRFLKRPVVRTLLIAWILFYIIGQVANAQYMRNILGLPVIIWLVYSLINLFLSARRARKQLQADIQSYSQISNPDHFDTCEGCALAINYSAKTVYLIDEGKRKTIPFAEILRWEMFYNSGDTLGGFVIGGNLGTAAGQAMIGGALGFGIFTLIGRWVNRRDDIGHVKFWVNDVEHTIVSVYVSNNRIIEQLQHFSMANGMKMH